MEVGLQKHRIRKDMHGIAALMGEIQFELLALKAERREEEFIRLSAEFDRVKREWLKFLRGGGDFPDEVYKLFHRRFNFDSDKDRQ